MTKLLEENRLKTFVPGLGWTGGSTKSQLMKLLASLARSSALARSTAVMDGDPKNQSTRKVFGQRDANGDLIPAEDNDILIGCRMMKSTDAEASSKEVFKVLEDDQPDLFLMDGAAAAESDFAKMILNNSTPEEFVEVLKELGYQLNLATTLLPKKNASKRNEALASLQALYDMYHEIEDVHFTVSLSLWEGDIMDNDSDDGFRYWFKHPLREQLLATGRYHELKMVLLPAEVMAVTSHYEVPFFQLIDPVFAKEAGISIRVRMALRKYVDLFRQQVEADPYLRGVFHLDAHEAVEG